MTVRTTKQDEINREEDMKKAQIIALNTIWLGMRDSNPRILVPETSALPLGESPI
jgi:hypothetical protein